MMNVNDFMQKALKNNEVFQGEFSDQLESLFGGQAPECYVLMCGDSRCSKKAFMGNEYTLGKFFGGPATMGNIVSDHIMATLAYNVDHLKTPYFVVCGHTGCGAVDATMGDFSGERPVLRDVLSLLKATYEPVKVPTFAAPYNVSTQNVLRNVQGQVLKVVSHFEKEIEAGSFTVLGAVVDNLGVMGPVGKLYFTSQNGEECFVS